MTIRALTAHELADAPSTRSFRDPAGRVISINRRILRIVNPTFWQEFQAVLKSETVQRFIRDRRLVATKSLEIDGIPNDLRNYISATGAAVVEHEPISFPSFPYEWAPELLYAAAGLTLDLAEALGAEDLGLKDGTPFNVLFRGPQPIFVDVLSIELRDPHDPVWLPYAQFVRTFLLPLLVNRRFGTPLHRVFVNNREGLGPEEVYHLAGWLSRIRPSFLGLVSLPTWLSTRKNLNDSIYRSKRLPSKEQARFVVRGTLRRLRKALQKLAPAVHRSVWSDYTQTTHYSAQEMEAKVTFVESAAESASAKRVLDIGCNTGRFSIACARKGAEVVAVDSDPVVVGLLWRTAQAEKLNILPLIVNLAHPTPATGWRNQECRSFLDRARGEFDLVLMLAVIHHLLVTERVPLVEILQLVTELTCDSAVIEFVPGSDPMFRRLLRGRDKLHEDYTQQAFEDACSKFFRITRKQQLAPGSRCLYQLQK